MGLVRAAVSGRPSARSDESASITPRRFRALVQELIARVIALRSQPNVHGEFV